MLEVSNQSRAMNRREFIRVSSFSLVGWSIFGYGCEREGKKAQLVPSENRLTPRFSPANPEIVLRRHPYPYRASLAITSDIDGTHPREFVNVHRYLNTKEDTPSGKGLGLDVADSFWMVTNNNLPDKIDPENHGMPLQMSYWRELDTQKEYSAESIRRFIEIGWIDSLHSYGDFNRTDEKDIAFTRQIAEKSVREWTDRGMRFQVWIDHGNRCNVQNFGSAGMYGGDLADYQQGDNPASPYYHTDLLIPFGIRYIWNSAIAASETRFSSRDLLYPLRLRDGQKVWGFRRFSSIGHDPQGFPQFVWTPYHLGKYDFVQKLDQLIETEGFVCVAQHLGSPYAIMDPMPPQALEPLKQLALRKDQGKILVARTSRLLNYNRVNNFLRFDVEKSSEQITIIIQGIDDPQLGFSQPTIDELRGITFYSPNPERTKILLGNHPVQASLIKYNPPDHTGKASISIDWFPEDHKDYSNWLKG